MSGPTIVDIPQTGTGSTGLTKSRYAQHDELYGRAIKNTLVDSLNSDNAITVPSTHATKQLDDKKLDRAGDTMTGDLTLTNADLSARDITASGTLTANSFSITADSTITNKLTMGSMEVTNDANITGNLTVGADLTVLGSTTTVQSNVVTIDDPVIEIGTDTSEDTTLDRGVTFMYHDGTDPQKGFFGWDRHYNAFVMRPVAVESPDNLIGGSVGNIHASELRGATLVTSGTITVDGISTFNEDVNIVDGDFSVDGKVDLSAPTKTTTVKGELKVDEATTVDDDFTATGTVDLAAEGKETTVKGSFKVDQGATIDGSFAATGTVDLAASELETTVKGSLKVDEGATIDNAFVAAGTVELAASELETTIKGTLQVDEATTVSDDFTATGTVNLAAVGKTTTVKGNLQVDESATFDSNVSVGTSGKVSFGNAHRQQIDLHSTSYGIGTQANTLYARTPGAFKWYRGGLHATSSAGTGGTKAMELDNNSNLTVTGNMTSLSDMRVKRNVETLESASDKLSQVRGVRFEKRDEPDGIKHIGVIAQEIETVFPEVVLTDPTTGIKSVAYANMVGALIQAHNEMRETIRAMQEKLDRLCP